MSDHSVQKTDAEWREQLTAPGMEPLTYRVTRQAATEPPFSGRQNLRVFALLCAAVESVESGRPVDLTRHPLYRSAFDAYTDRHLPEIQEPLLERLGVKNGDIVKAVNGKPLTSTEGVGA